MAIDSLMHKIHDNLNKPLSNSQSWNIGRLGIAGLGFTFLDCLIVKTKTQGKKIIFVNRFVMQNIQLKFSEWRYLIYAKTAKNVDNIKEKEINVALTGIEIFSLFTSCFPTDFHGTNWMGWVFRRLRKRQIIRISKINPINITINSTIPNVSGIQRIVKSMSNPAHTEVEVEPS